MILWPNANLPNLQEIPRTHSEMEEKVFQDIQGWPGGDPTK